MTTRIHKPADPTLVRYQLFNLPHATAQRIRQGAGARQMSQAAFLGALIAVWDAVRARADNGDAELAATLAALGMETVER